MNSLFYNIILKFSKNINLNFKYDIPRMIFIKIKHVLKSVSNKTRYL